MPGHLDYIDIPVLNLQFLTLPCGVELPRECFPALIVCHLTPVTTPDSQIPKQSRRVEVHSPWRMNCNDAISQSLMTLWASEKSSKMSIDDTRYGHNKNQRKGTTTHIRLSVTLTRLDSSFINCLSTSSFLAKFTSRTTQLSNTGARSDCTKNGLTS